MKVICRLRHFHDFTRAMTAMLPNRARRRRWRIDPVPRIGEEISLEYDGDQFPRFRVTAVLHVPDNVQVINDDVLDAYVVLTVRKL